MPDGYGVDPEDLTGAAGEILASLDPVSGLSLESVSGDSASYGHDELYQAFAEFGVVWQVATTVLGSRVMSAAGTLGAAAESYVQSDDAGVQALTELTAGL